MSLASKLAIVIVACSFMATAWKMRNSHMQPVVLTMTNVKIEREIGEYGYWMSLEDQPNQPPFYAIFCNSEEAPPFGEGQVLNYLAVDNYTDCWSVASDHAHYRARRNSNGTLYRFK